MKNKCCLIIPYFGKLPNYFQLFLNSCETNPSFHWMIFTDDDTEYRFPPNVEKVNMNMNQFKLLLGQKFDFELKINEPHKLCDLKPAYGYIFEEYIEKYDFWGHCDVDLVFGDIGKFITDELLDNYDKLFCLGHFILYRNNNDNNRMFMRSVNGELWFKESFSVPETTVFDETFGGNKNINTIFKHYDKNVLMADWSMNSLIAPANFVKTTYNSETNDFDNEKGIDALYVWDKGRVLRYYIRDNKLITEEFMYIHFQSRKMGVYINQEKQDMYKILGDGFYELEVNEVNETNFNKVKRRIISTRYIKIVGKWKMDGLRKKVCRLIKKSN